MSTKFLPYIVGIGIGIAIAAPQAGALRIARPPTFYEWNSNTFSQLNEFLLQMWNITNGRTQLDTPATDPDGNRRCSKGEIVLYDPGSSQQLCVCIDPATLDWDCASLTE